jgi:hypothetical protein
MLEELLFLDRYMRNLKKEEFDLIVFMLKDSSIYMHIVNNLSTSTVQEMVDEGMGSLRFKYDDEKIRRFGKEVASVSILDIDQIPVSFAINIDEDGNLFELDVFKGDFSPLKRFPIPPYNLLPPPQMV